VTVEAEIAAPAALIGDETRSTFLTALVDGSSLPASDLAARAGVSASTASVQLAKLVEGGLVEVERNGRHSYYRLANQEIAKAMEALAAIAPRRAATSRKHARVGSDLRAARTCYDHLAGKLGVALLESLQRQDLLTDELEVTPQGADRFARLGIEVDKLARGRRPLTRPCLDWTERRHHLAGALGAAFTTSFLERGWIERLPGSRAVRVTETGRRALASALAVHVDGR
jgi:DNA-binding transcriptional ArsR family regulator